jgi:hypothetical protein
MKVMYGGPVANASGSLAGVVASHNRGGSYFRRRTVPVKSTTTYATNAKARLAAASSAWRTLTAAQRFSWETWAQTNPVVDRLGEKRILTGQQAYIQLNVRILFIGGTQILVPPVIGGPNALTSVTLTADIGSGDFEVAFTPTPLATGLSAWVRAAVVNSAGITFVQNLYKLCVVSAAAQASPLTLDTDIESRFGTLIVGQQVFVAVHVMRRADGQLSQPALSRAIVVSTP